MGELSFEEQHEHILEWYGKVILGYLCSDIKKLLPIQVNADGLGGCAAPLAMTVFSTMDRLGYLTMENDKDLDETEKHIKDFCATWMVKAKGGAVYNKSKTRDLLAEIFRHGVAHQFISPYGHALVKANETGHVVVEIAENGFYVLQSDILATDFLETIYGHLTPYLRNPNKKDSITRFYERLQRRQQIDEDEFSKIRRRLEKKQEKDYEIPVVKSGVFKTEPSGTWSRTNATSYSYTGMEYPTTVTTDPSVWKR